MRNKYASSVICIPYLAKSLLLNTVHDRSNHANLIHHLGLVQPGHRRLLGQHLLPLQQRAEQPEHRFEPRLLGHSRHANTDAQLSCVQDLRQHSQKCLGLYDGRLQHDRQ